MSGIQSFIVLHCYLFPPRCFFFIFLSCKIFFLFSNSLPVILSPSPSSKPLFRLLSILPSRFPKSQLPLPILSNPDQSSPPNPSIPPLSLRPFRFSFPIFSGTLL